LKKLIVTVPQTRYYYGEAVVAVMDRVKEETHQQRRRTNQHLQVVVRLDILAIMGDTTRQIKTASTTGAATKRQPLPQRSHAVTRRREDQAVSLNGAGRLPITESSYRAVCHCAVRMDDGYANMCLKPLKIRYQSLGSAKG